jgi:hypothetical protein
MENNQDPGKGPEYKSFAFKRMIVAIIVILAFIWAFSAGIRYISGTRPIQSGQTASNTPEQVQAQPPASDPAEQLARGAESLSSGPEKHLPGLAKSGEPVQEPHQQVSEPEKSAETGESTGTSAQHGQPAAQPQTDAAHGPADQVATEPKPIGVTFVEALMKPMEHELKKRFWGWRPNDIINFTDNTNYFQLGVLEVTRRAIVQLAERISRTGTTDAFNRYLENAMNGFMINADRYWFPSPESKYMESLDDLESYRKQLLTAKASFYTRADNLIPLLAAYEDLLGSCDENLVKTKERDGSSVGFFASDNYFFYAKGVASAMAESLEAIHHDFLPLLESRHGGSELLHHALVSCQWAASLDPWLITNSDLDGILANHRANMAAPISHARFYLGQLIKTLST